MLTDFQNSFTVRLIGKFATHLYLNIQPHLNCVATLPCEISEISVVQRTYVLPLFILCLFFVISR